MHLYLLLISLPTSSASKTTCTDHDYSLHAVYNSSAVFRIILVTVIFTPPPFCVQASCFFVLIPLHNEVLSVMIYMVGLHNIIVLGLIPKIGAHGGAL